MQERTNSAAQVHRAEAVQTRMQRQGRWYPLWMVAWGLFTIAMVSVEGIAYHTLWLGVVFAIVLLAGAVAIGSWERRQPVRPVSKRQRNRNWMIPWIVLYVAGHAYVGPVLLGNRPGAWALMGVVIALPAFVEAARYWRLRRL